MKRDDNMLNPIQAFVQVWRTFERLAMVFSAALVLGTFGYVSLHAFA